MYDVALSVLSCLRAGTDVHVAWVVAGHESGTTEAVALTPGGGRMGSLLNGALDHTLAEALPGLDAAGGLVRVSLGPVESLVSGLPEGHELTVAVVAGNTLPHELWEALADRSPVAFALDLDGKRFSGVKTLDGIGDNTLTDDRLACSFSPVPRVVIVGAGPIAEAIHEGFDLIGWQPSVIAEVGAATGLMATLSTIDAIVVMGHDVETAGRGLQGAIASGAGYIASIGSPRMQGLREEWLAYRGVGWPDRVHGPAGLAIGASNPGEIAISIVAEAIASLRLGVSPDG